MLCHESPNAVAEALRSPFYADPDIKVYLHYDERRSAEQLRKLKGLIPPHVQASLLEQRVRCQWGEYSLVEATRRLIECAIHDKTFRADRVLLVSGSCIPFRPATSLRKFLEQFPETEFIEAVDAERNRWVQGGLQEERYQLYFPFNFKSRRRWFEHCVSLQKSLGIKRRLPSNLKIHFGSQWFCITRQTAQYVLSRLSEEIHARFFKTCWIPDEFVIQTFVAEATSKERIAGHSLTYYEFDSWGRPLVLDNGHFDHLMSQPFFFARKLAPSADSLRRQIQEVVSHPEVSTTYFDQVGQPTPDYRCFMARASTVKAARGHVGTLEDTWRGIMDRNERAYIVLWSACLPYARALIAESRQAASSDLLIFDPEFELHSSTARKSDASAAYSPPRAWIEYAPASSLYEFVNSHPTEMAAVLLDPSVESWFTKFVPWDGNVILVCLDPPHLTKIQRAEAALRHAPRHWGSSMVKAIYQAAFTNTWLPQESFLRLASENSTCAKSLTLTEAAKAWPVQILQLLLAAQEKLPADQFFNTDHIAWVQLRRAKPAQNLGSSLRTVS